MECKVQYSTIRLLIVILACVVGIEWLVWNDCCSRRCTNLGDNLSQSSTRPNKCRRRLFEGNLSIGHTTPLRRTHLRPIMPSFTCVAHALLPASKLLHPRQDLVATSKSAVGNKKHRAAAYTPANKLEER